VTEDEAGVLRQRRVPCMIAYLHPFRLVDADGEADWEATIEQVNQRAWDYVAVHSLVGGIDVGLASPYQLVVGRDGALALPPIGELRSVQVAVEFFNRCLAALLLGGVYCEAISSDGLDLGSIIDWSYIRAQKSGSAAPNRFHQQIRYLQSSPLEAIALVGPRRIALADLRSAMTNGLRMLGAVPLVRGEYLLKGSTSLARLDWGSALANLWIVVEQLLAQLWDREVVAPTLVKDPGRARQSQLMDTRSWTASTRIEMLFQKGVIDLDILHMLGRARKARNDLHHSGQHPSAGDAQAAYSGLVGLLTLALNGERAPLLGLDFGDHALVDPFAPPRPTPGEPTHWMSIPKLPGEADLERAEATACRASLQESSVVPHTGPTGARTRGFP
jgi:hypothetical protein